jgi:hypothetical protein
VYFFIISLLAFHDENILDQWYQSRLVLIVFLVQVVEITKTTERGGESIVTVLKQF